MPNIINLPHATKYNHTYPLLGALIEYMNENKSSFHANLKENLRNKLENRRYFKEINALGGLHSDAMDAFLDGFIASLPKPVEAHVVDENAPIYAEIVDNHEPAMPRYTSIDITCHRCRGASCRCEGETSSMWFWLYLFSANRTTTETHHYHTTDEKKNSAADIIFAVIMFIAVVMIALSAVVAAIYLFGQVADIIERLANREGSAYAMLSLTTLGMSAAGSFFGATLVLPLILLAAGASNPVGWSIFGIICLGMVFTSLAHGLLFHLPVAMFDKSFQKSFGSNDFSSKDFGRVQLTEAEIRHLDEEEQLDPMKVSLAIGLLRQEMGGGAVPNKFGNHALFSQSCRSELQQKNLNIIRKLRAGDLDDQEIFQGTKITIGSMTVDLIKERPTREAVALAVAVDAEGGEHEVEVPQAVKV
jgi:Sec-independent protein secretion pathway component TatC